MSRTGSVSSFRLLIVISLLLLSACATTTNKSSITTLNKTNPKILLMPIDVELSVLTAGGMLEPRADWTEAAQKHMRQALKNYQLQRGGKLVQLDNAEQEDLGKFIADIERLHSAVGTSILIHEFNAQFKLPTKADKFEWTLGTGIAELQQYQQADYALFLFVRDSYSSSGRILLTIAASLLGVGVANGQQIGFASLVDLNTGEVTWFNRLFSTTGDLRTLESAEKTISTLLDGLPQ